MTVRENVALSQHTTFRVGGQARYFVEAYTLGDVRAAIQFAREKHVPFFVLGGGSNILADDEGCNGVVIKVASRSVSVEGTLLTVEAGESWDEVVSYAVGEGLWGIENLSGIPGTAGAAPVQNIGAYGASLADCLESLDALNVDTLEERTFSAEECAFGYRTSVFKKEGKHIVTRIRLRLSTEAKPKLSYKDLQERFPGGTAALSDIRRAVIAIRAEKFPDLSKEGTAGSFFLNPIVTKEEARRLATRFPDLPQFDDQDGIKIPLAWILDRILALRGKKEGGVRAFERQPLVIVNDGSARARDIRSFACAIQKEIQEKIGITVEPEVCILRNCVIDRTLS